MRRIRVAALAVFAVASGGGMCCPTRDFSSTTALTGAELDRVGTDCEAACRLALGQEIERLDACAVTGDTGGGTVTCSGRAHEVCR